MHHLVAIDVSSWSKSLSSQVQDQCHLNEGGLHALKMK